MPVSVWTGTFSVRLGSQHAWAHPQGKIEKRRPWRAKTIQPVFGSPPRQWTAQSLPANPHAPTLGSAVALTSGLAALVLVSLRFSCIRFIRCVISTRLLVWLPQNRGEVALAVGSYSGALALLGQSPEGRSSLAWAAVAANTGACFRAMADGARTPWERLQLLENALAYGTEALAVRAAALPKGHAAIGDTLSSLGGALRAATEGDLGGDGSGVALSERVARLAVQVLETAPGAGRESTQWATAVSNLGLLLLQPLPPPITAAAASMNAEDEDEDEDGENDEGAGTGALMTGAAVDNEAAATARASAEQWRATEAESLLRQALSVRRKFLGKSHPDTIETMILLSRAVVAAGNGSPSATAESASIRASADSLYEDLRIQQEEDNHRDMGRA